MFNVIHCFTFYHSSVRIITTRIYSLLVVKVKITRLYTYRVTGTCYMPLIHAVGACRAVCGCRPFAAGNQRASHIAVRLTYYECTLL